MDTHIGDVMRALFQFFIQTMFSLVVTSQDMFLYTIVYSALTRNQGKVDTNSTVLVNIYVTSTTEDSQLYSFYVSRLSQPTITAFVDSKPCYPSCTYSLNVGGVVDISFYQTTPNLFAIRQDDLYDRTLLFDNCDQDLITNDQGGCRSKQTSVYDTCVCNYKSAYGCSTGKPIDISCNGSSLPTTTTRSVPPSTISSYSKPTSTRGLTTMNITNFTSTPTTYIPIEYSTAEQTTTEIITTTTKQLTTTTTVPTSISTSKLVATTIPSTISTTSMQTTTQTTTTVTSPDFPLSLQNLTDDGVGLNNVTYVLNATLVYSNTKGNLSSGDFQDIATILHNSASLNGINGSDAQLILQNFDNVLFVNETTVRVSKNASQTLLAVLPLLVQNTNSSRVDFLEGVNLGFSSSLVSCSSADTIGLQDNTKNFQLLLAKDIPAAKLNSIQIPTTQFCSTGKRKKRDTQGSQAVFTIYRTRTLFAGSSQYRNYDNHIREQTESTVGDPAAAYALPTKCDDQTALAPSPVMSGSLLKDGLKISRLDTQDVMATLRFNVSGLLTPLHGKFVVTWWDEEKKVWARSDECTTEREGDLVMATCPHLTDFTLVIDGALNDPSLCQNALIDLGYAVNGLSLASLTFLLIMNFSAYIPRSADSAVLSFLSRHSMLQKDFITLFYNLSLFLFYLSFTAFSDSDVSKSACEEFAAFSYSFFTCSILLTLFQSGRVILLIAPKTLKQCLHSFVQPLCAVTISFLVPFVASIFLLFFTNFFERNDCFCWVRPDYIIYAVVIPTSIVVLNASVCTILLSIRLFGATRIFREMGSHKDKQIKTKIIAILLMQFTLGMPWVLEYFTMYTARATAWHYIFTIVMGSQGTVMTLLFFYKTKRLHATSRRRQRGMTTSRNDGIEITKETFDFK